MKNYSQNMINFLKLVEPSNNNDISDTMKKVLERIEQRRKARVETSKEIEEQIYNQFENKIVTQRNNIMNYLNTINIKDEDRQNIFDLLLHKGDVAEIKIKRLVKYTE